MCYSVPSQVELCQSCQTSQVGGEGDLIASEVEHSQLAQVSQVLYVLNLSESVIE